MEIMVIDLLRILDICVRSALAFVTTQNAQCKNLLGRVFEITLCCSHTLVMNLQALHIVVLIIIIIVMLLHNALFLKCIWIYLSQVIGLDF